MNRNVLSLCISSLLLAVAGTAWAEEAPKPAPITMLKESGPVMYGRSAKIKAVVEAVDPATRSITVKGAKGRPLSMRVADRVRNLPDIAVGDEVVVRYNESVGVEVRHVREGESIVAAEYAMHDGESGQQSGASARTTEIASVESVNPQGKSLVLTTPDGRFLDLYVRDRAVLDTLEAGDSVLATYTEAVVVSVEGPKDKDAKDAKTKRKPRRK
jgi:hypothetical protein